MSILLVNSMGFVTHLLIRIDNHADNRYAIVLHRVVLTVPINHVKVI